jgi:hypothetical protein
MNGIVVLRKLTTYAFPILLITFSVILFVFLSVICANVANVYSASVGWEIVAPSALIGRKEYLILGLGLTTIYILINDLFSLEFLLEVSDAALVNLCLVFLIAYILRQRSQTPPNLFAKSTYFAAWALSSTIAAIHYSNEAFLTVSPFAVSLTAILLTIFVSLLGKRVFG